MNRNTERSSRLRWGWWTRQLHGAVRSCLSSRCKFWHLHQQGDGEGLSQDHSDLRRENFDTCLYIKPCSKPSNTVYFCVCFFKELAFHCAAQLDALHRGMCWYLGYWGAINITKKIKTLKSFKKKKSPSQGSLPTS